MRQSKILKVFISLYGECFEVPTNYSIHFLLNLPFYTNREDLLDSTALPDQAEPLHNHIDSPLKPPEVKSI